MPMLTMLGEHSLLASAYRFPCEWWLVYLDTERRHWWNRFLQPGFQHVIALKRDGRIWIAMRWHAEFLDVDVIRSDNTPWAMFPKAHIQRVVSLRKEGSIRSPAFVGPITCVEFVKALLGIRAFWIRTPYQLFKHCEAHVCRANRNRPLRPAKRRS